MLREAGVFPAAPDAVRALTDANEVLNCETFTEESALRALTTSVREDDAFIRQVEDASEAVTKMKSEEL